MSPPRFVRYRPGSDLTPYTKLRGVDVQLDGLRRSAKARGFIDRCAITVLAGGRGLSPESLHMGGLHVDWSRPPLLPFLGVDAYDEEPQAEGSFADERGELDPGDQIGGEPGCENVGEAVDQVSDAIDRQQDTDGSGQEPRPEHQVCHAEDVEAEEHGVDGVAGMGQVAGQMRQGLQL